MGVDVEVVAEILFGEAYAVYRDVAEGDAVDGVFVVQTVQQQYTTASHVGLIFTLEPVFSAVFAYFLLSERLTVRGYLGAALMLVSLLIMELDVPALLKKDEKAP